MADMKHIAVAYPTLEEGLDAAQHLGKAALGLETLGVNELPAQAWVAIGAGLGQVLPPGGPMVMKAMASEDKQVLAKACEDLRAEAIDWKTFLSVILSIVLKLL